MRPALANGLAIFAIGLATLPLSALIFAHRGDPQQVALPPAPSPSFVPGSAPGPVVAVPPPRAHEGAIPPAPTPTPAPPATSRQAVSKASPPPKAVLPPTRPLSPAPKQSSRVLPKPVQAVPVHKAPVQKAPVAVLPSTRPLPKTPPKAAAKTVAPSPASKKSAVVKAPPATLAATQKASTKAAPGKPPTQKANVAAQPQVRPPASAPERESAAPVQPGHSSIVVVPRRGTTDAAQGARASVAVVPAPIKPEAQAHQLQGTAARPYLAQGRRLTDWLYGGEHLDRVWAAFRPTVKAGWNNSLSDFAAYRTEGQQTYGSELRVLRETVLQKNGTNYYLRTAVFERDPKEHWTVIFGLNGAGRVTEFGVVRAGSQ